MKAIIQKKYGSPDVLQYTDAEKPVPKDNEVLVRVLASSVNAADWHKMSGKPLLVRLMGGGFFSPNKKIPGGDIAGIAEAVGKKVKHFKPGDEVFGDTSGGGYAEYVCATEDVIALKPSNLSFEEAAAVPTAGITALIGIRDKGEIQSGQKVLITGASGGVGSYAVQITKSYGTDVTAVCRTKSFDIVKSIGADHVIDYTKEDYTKTKEHYDLVIDCAAYKPLPDILSTIKPCGNYVIIGGELSQLFRAMVFGKKISKKENKKIKSFVANTNNKDLLFIKNLIEAGKIKSVIDKHYPLSETAKAIRYFNEEHPIGKVVIGVTQLTSKI
ncbi:MAG: NAD(P)-dependent alcohol dehydrogenase [Ignavibacteria bacterium]|jgi:NADPH:quinone reductase-like Zn-dependent oxidoreductase